MHDVWTVYGPSAVIGLTVVFTLVLVLLALWIALPFGVFGTKPLLRDLLASHRETNRKLEELRRAVENLDRFDAPPWRPGSRVE